MNWAYSLYMYCLGTIVPCRAHRFEGLCHGTKSGDLVPTTLGVIQSPPGGMAKLGGRRTGINCE